MDVKVRTDEFGAWCVYVLREGVWTRVARRNDPFDACHVARRWGW